MKRALVAASVAALLLPLAWTTPAQAVSPCDSYLMDYQNGKKYSSPDEAFKACYTAMADDDSVESDDFASSTFGEPGSPVYSESNGRWAVTLGNTTVVNAADVTFPDGFNRPDGGFGRDDLPDITGKFISLDGRSSTRSKTSDGFTARNLKRINRMAQHLSGAPGDVINIHAYGPDKDTALAKGHLVREQLRADISRLGGNPSAHHVFVAYAGDPAHKQGVDVTIHQHAGSKHTKAHAWANTHLASKDSTLTDEHRQAVTAHLVSSSTPEQVQAAWDIDMNEDVSLVDPAEITQIARYFLDHPTEHILVRDHVGTGVHGSTVADAVVAEMARLAAEDGVITTRDGFLDWLNQVVVAVNDFTDDLSAAEVEIHAVTVALDDAATAIATTITDVTTLVGDVITDVETVINPIVTAVDEGTVVVKTVKDVVMAVAV